MLSKSQIDRIGYQLRDGDIDASVLRKLKDVRDEYFQAYLQVEHVLADQLGYKLTGRPSKSTVSIVEKLRRESARLSQVQDIAGCRIIVSDIRAQDEICGAAAVMLGNVSSVDRRERPKNGYRAVHLIANYEGRPVEIQVRTQLQHAWAEISEKISDEYGQDIKYGKGESWAIEFLSELSMLTLKLEEFDTRLADFRRDVKLLQQVALRRNKSPRKVVDEIRLQRRLLFYKVREHFGGLKDR